MSTHKPAVLTLEDRSVPATLVGTVYEDVNGDSRQGAAERGFAGATIQLDIGSDTVVDQTVLTDAGGAYTFANVPVGTHTVTVNPPEGMTAIGSTTNLLTITPAESTAIETVVGFGLRPSGSVNGFVFTDLNGDGLRGTDEPGAAGVRVGVDLLGDGTVEFNVTTQTDGSFEVANVPNGVAKVTVTPPVNYRTSGPATSTVTVSAATPAAPLALGVVPTTGLSGKITSTLGNLPLGGVTVYLDRATTGTAAVTTTTDTTGTYVFANVPAGRHTITVDAPAGAAFVTADGTGVLTPTVTGVGGVTAGLDLAVRYAGSVRSVVFTDSNGNGVHDVGVDMTYLPGSTQIDVFNSGRLVAVTPVAQADGTYRVDGIPDGTHTLLVTPPNSPAGTTPRESEFVVAGGSVATAAAYDLLTTSPLPTEPTEPGGPTTPPTVPPVPTTPPTTPGNPLPLGNGLAIGSADGPIVQEYSFTANPDGTLTATKTRQLSTAGIVGSRVVMADFTGDGVADTVTATGPGSSAFIRVYDGVTGQQVAAWDGFESKFTGGVNLAAGDFNGDGKADVVVAADVGGGPRVRVFNAAQFQGGADAAQGKLLADFFAIEDSRFRGGARVAVGDLNKDGTDDLVVAAGAGGGPRIAIYDGRSVGTGQAPRKLVGDFFAFEQRLRNGATVAVGDVNGDGYDDLVAGAGDGGSPRVVVFNGFDVASNRGDRSARVADFFVNGDSESRDGTVVTVKDLDGDGKADVVAGNGAKAYVFTSRSIVAQYLNPRPSGPQSMAELDAFGSVSGINLG